MLKKIVDRNDKVITEMLRSSDPHESKLAHQKLFDRYASRLLKVFSTEGVDKADAEESIAYAFSKLPIILESSNERIPIGHYLNRLARKRLSEKRPIASRPARPPEEKSAVDLRSLIFQLSNSLDETDSLILKMRFLEEMSYREVAEVLDIPISEVGFRQHKALKKLRELIQSQGIDISEILTA